MTLLWSVVKKNVELSMEYAKEMGVKTMTGLSGEVMCKTDSEKILLMENLKRAGVPGRHELHTGEVNYPFVIAAAEKAGYDRYFGMEYFPTYDHDQSVKDNLKYLRG